MRFFSLTPGDWGSMTQLFFDNASTLLGVLAAVYSMTSFGVPVDIINQIVYQRMVPALGLSLFFGNTYYAYLALRRSKKEGRPFTAQPYGIDTAGAFAFVYNVTYPVFFSSSGTATEKFTKAFHVSLAANLVSGTISVVLGAFGPQMVRAIPPAALLVPVAGISIAFLGLEQASTPFGAPLVGFMTIMTLFLGWYAKVRLCWGKYKMPEALQVIVVGMVLGWATGLNTTSDVEAAAELTKWYGMTWAGGDIVENFSCVKDYLGIVFPIAISAVGSSLMALVSAKNAGEPYPIAESMVIAGVGTIIAALFGSPFGAIMYFGHPAYKKSGARMGYSLLNGFLYLILSWFGLLALIRSVVNQATIGPIVLVVGLMLMEEALRFLPSRHYAAFLFGLFPSIADWVTTISSRVPLEEVALDGSSYNSNLPHVTDGWWGVLGLKRGAILVSLCWVAILVHVIDRKWWQAASWASISAFFAALGVIHVPVAGFETFTTAVSDVCSPVLNDDGVAISSTCWGQADQWQYAVAYLIMAVVCLGIEFLRYAGLGDLEEPVQEASGDAFKDWYKLEKTTQETQSSSESDNVSREVQSALSSFRHSVQDC